MRKVLVLGVCCFAGFAQAYDEVSPWTQVKNIFVNTTGPIPYIQFEPGSLPGCYGDSGAYLSHDNEVGSQQAFSVLLAASMSGKQVQAFYNYATVPAGYNGWGLCTIESISLKQ